MESRVLLHAREYEMREGGKIDKLQRGAFHLSPLVGWMNDPNGFSCYDGSYHLFYQYYPYKCEWGPMHWGHAISRDLLHWEYLPAALAPDQPYDLDGCFSGSAITVDSKHLLIYTGVVKEYEENGKFKYRQRQSIAIGDGRDYLKYEKNPVIDEKVLPEGANPYEFRDPKIWQKEDGSFRCVTGNLKKDGKGQILLFESENAFDWKFERVLLENNGQFGKMWECPDFFKMGDSGVLIMSPQDMKAQGDEYPNGNFALCLIGEVNDETDEFVPKTSQTIDYGMDFYAPQTMLTEDGRRIMIGWMQNWDTIQVRQENGKWFGQMSLPRELEIRNNRLLQRPVRELLTMRHNEVICKNVCIFGKCCLDQIKGRCVDLVVEVACADKEGNGKFELRFAQGIGLFCSLSYDFSDRKLTMDRRFSGSRRAAVHSQSCRIENENEALRFRLILDRYSAEVFVGDGEQTMSMVLFTDLSADGISFRSDQKMMMNLEKYDL
ncbi:MAG: glycoside hydrolase family 32 protein [Lachnospiraceae bacterium]|nr:glycoside hydrolase family 32 protein [Lachnospiraceae bacterium]